MSQVNNVHSIPKALTVKTSHYIISAMSLVTAFAWNDAVKASISKFYMQPAGQISASFVYALVLTIITVFVIYLLPNTKSELPDSAQQKVEVSEMIDKVQVLEDKIDNLGAENERLRQSIPTNEKMQMPKSAPPKSTPPNSVLSKFRLF